MPRLRMAAPAVMLVMFASVLLFCAVQSTGLSSSMHKTTTSSKLAAAAAKLNAAVHLQAPGDTPLESASSSSSSSSSPSSSSESVSSVSSAAGIKIDFVVKDPAVTSAPAQITHADCDADLDDFIPDVPLTCALPGAKGLLEVNSTRTHAQARSESAVELKPVRNYHKIDQYQQYKRLGAGAFGEVWEYRMNGDPAKKAVVKFPLIQEHPPTPGQLADPDFQEKPSLQKQTEIMWTECEFATKIHARYPTNFLFMNCLQMQMDLQHENSKDDELYIVLESGGPMTLEEAMAQDKLNFKNALIVIYQLLKALSYLKKIGIVHHDLKPANVMFRLDGADVKIKLVDYGGMNDYINGVYSGVHTPSFAPPEGSRISKSKPASYDVFSVGRICMDIIMNELRVSINREMKCASTGSQEKVQLQIDRAKVSMRLEQFFNLENEVGIPKFLETLTPLLDRYMSLFGAPYLSMLQQMLVLPAAQRPDADEMLRHEIFSMFVTEAQYKTDAFYSGVSTKTAAFTRNTVREDIGLGSLQSPPPPVPAPRPAGTAAAVMKMRGVKVLGAGAGVAAGPPRSNVLIGNRFRQKAELGAETLQTTTIGA